MGADSIQVEPSKVKFTGVEADGNNLIYQTNQGPLTIQNGKNKTITAMNMTNRIISLPKINKNVAENLWFMEDDFATDENNLD